MSSIENVKGRLHNWKFSQAHGEALRCPAGSITDRDLELIESLGAVFGNPGHGLEGHMEAIIGAALASLDLMKESAG